MDELIRITKDSVKLSAYFVDLTELNDIGDSLNMQKVGEKIMKKMQEIQDDFAKIQAEFI